MIPGEPVDPTRFDACERDPRFPAAMSVVPPLPRVRILDPFGWVFLCFWCAIAIGMATMMADQPDAGGFALWALVVGAVGVAGILGPGLRRAWRGRDPGTVERCLALLEACDGRQAALAYRDGKRRLARIAATAAPGLAPGTLGIAYLRDGELVGFTPLT